MSDDELTEDEIRRLFISDEQWSRTHATWKALRPKRNFDTYCESDESVEDYAKRIGVPLELAEQWLYGLFYWSHVTDNYGWIDYSTVEFVRERWTVRQILELQTVFPSYVEEVAADTPLEQFGGRPEDLDNWRKLGTWRVPPVALDLEGLGVPPPWSEVRGRFQLIEGHTRLGRLLSLARYEPDRLAEEHDIFLVRVKRP